MNRKKMSQTVLDFKLNLKKFNESFNTSKNMEYYLLSTKWVNKWIEKECGQKR